MKRGPGKKETNRRKLLYAGAVTGYFAAWFAWGAFRPEEPHPAHFYLPPMFGLTILLHELGHLGAAAWVGFRFREIMLFGMVLRRNEGKWEFEVNRFVYGGHAWSRAVGLDNLSRRLAIIVAAGPGVTIVSIAIAALLLLVWPSSPALLVWIGLSLITLMWSFRSNVKNDLMHLRWALGKHPESNEYLAAYVIDAEVDEETRRLRLEELNVPHAVWKKRIHELIDRDAYDQIRKELEDILAAPPVGAMEDRVEFECLAAYYFAMRGFDLAKAIAFLPPEERAKAYNCERAWLYAAILIAAGSERWQDVIRYCDQAASGTKLGYDPTRWFQSARRSAERHLERASRG